MLNDSSAYNLDDSNWDSIFLDPLDNVEPEPQRPEDQQKQSAKSVSGNIFDFGGLELFPYQAALLSEMFKRKFIKRGFIIWPRRAGKTELMTIYLLYQSFIKALTTKTASLRYALVYPDLNSGKRAAGEKLEQRSVGLPNRKYSENRGVLTYTLTGEYRQDIQVTIEILGLQNKQHRRGAGYDGIVGDERATLPEGFKPIINPMISDKIKGDTFLIFVGTPDEGGTFWNDYDDYKKNEDRGDRSYFTWWSNYDKLKHITKENAQQQLLDYGEEFFNIEYGCKRGQITGARIFSAECSNVIKEDRVRMIPWDITQKKWMTCDIGSSKRDLFAIWITQANHLTGKWEHIDYTQIASASEEKVFKWVQSRGHDIGQVILPWDGGIGVRSVKKLLEEKFPNSKVTVLPKVKIEERIRMARRVFPVCNFHSQFTLMGWNCLKKYSRKRDKERNIYVFDPKHDKFSHGADAFTYFCLADQTGHLDRHLNQISQPYYPVVSSIQTAKRHDTLGSFIDKQRIV